MMLLLNAFPFLASAGLVAKYPLANGNWLGEFNINGNTIWQIIIGPLVTPASAAEIPLIDQVKNYIQTMANFYETDADFMVDLAKCESGLNVEVENKNEPKGGPSFGLFQWQVGSWAHYNKKLKLNLDRSSWQDQTKMTAQVLKLDNGWSNWYNCTQFIRYGTWDKTKWHE